jgi:hypothetical protein
VPSYSVLRAATNTDACFVSEQPAVGWWWKPTKGQPVAPESGHVQLEMSKRIGGKKVTDIVENSLRYLIVSERVRAVFEAKASANVEYLPTTLIDHKGRAVKAPPFFIANVLDLVDAVDRRATVCTENPLRPRELSLITRLALDEGKIPSGRLLFRLTPVPRAVIAHVDLVAALHDAGVQGLGTLPLGVDWEIPL